MLLNSLGPFQYEYEYDGYTVTVTVTVTYKFVQPFVENLSYFHVYKLVSVEHFSLRMPLTSSV